MNKININRNWKFAFSALEEWLNPGNFSDAVTVDLPHDYRIGLDRSADAAGGSPEAYYKSGIGYYQYELDADELDLVGKRVCVAFDGVYRLAEVRFNGDLVAMHQGGYTPFSCDLTSRMHAGKNLLQVRVNGFITVSSRWYPGAGIYREVNLLVGDCDGYIKENGVRVKTEVADETASVVSVTTAMCLKKDSYTLTYTVCEKGSNAVVARGEYPISVTETGGEICVEKSLVIPHCKLWSADSPSLYTVKVAVLSNTCKIDTSVNFGVRTVVLNPREGLLINGTMTKLKGGCVHHDNGILGSRSYYSSEARKVQKLKDSGFNAIRCAHNPPSNVFLEACDSLGMYVINEFFDVWREGKRSNDEHIYFEDTWEREMECVVDRDYNRACVIIWSTGNEIVERDGHSDGAAWSQKVADKTRALDSSRLVTNALCDIWGNYSDDFDKAKYPDKWANQTAAFAEPLDIVGYNYLLDRYDGDLAAFPARFIAGTETFPSQSLENWRAVESNPRLIGDFVWTAWDYLGESGIGHSKFDVENTGGLREFPWETAFCGDIDICGNKRPQSHFRDFVWSGRTTPYLAVTHPSNYGKEEKLSDWGWQELQESWTFPSYENQPITVTVYSAGDTVKLFINDLEVGSQPAGEPHRFTAKFNTTYTPGKIEAVSYRSGIEIARASLQSADIPHSLKITPETQFGEIIFYNIEVIDRNNIKVPYATNKITLTGNILATGTSNPAPTDSHLSTTPTAHQGTVTVAAIGEIGAEMER